MQLTDIDLLGAVDAFDAERSRWGTRYNKMLSPPQWEVFRCDDDGVPVVMATTTGECTAEYERDEMSSIQAMKSALATLT